jgi:hypothetical protein
MASILRVHFTYILQKIHKAHYEAMVLYVCLSKGWAIKSGPCTATFNDLLCFPF